MGFFPPDTDLGLLNESTNFDTRITATPTAFGLTAADALAFHNLLTSYTTLLATATNPGTRTKAAIQAKNTAKLALLDKARQLVKVIKANPAVSDEQRVLLNLPPRDGGPTPAPLPATRPQLSVDPFGNVKIKDETTPLRRGKPHGVFAAVLFTKIGPTDTPAPASIADAQYAGLATRSKHELALPPGSNAKTLWVMAMWVNDKGEGGPMGDPVRTTIAA